MGSSKNGRCTSLFNKFRRLRVKPMQFYIDYIEGSSINNSQGLLPGVERTDCEGLSQSSLRPRYLPTSRHLPRIKIAVHITS